MFSWNNSNINLKIYNSMFQQHSKRSPKTSNSHVWDTINTTNDWVPNTIKSFTFSPYLQTNKTTQEKQNFPIYKNCSSLSFMSNWLFCITFRSSSIRSLHNSSLSPIYRRRWKLQNERNNVHVLDRKNPDWMKNPKVASDYRERLVPKFPNTHRKLI
jgi:hypothetical protein